MVHAERTLHTVPSAPELAQWRGEALADALPSHTHTYSSAAERKPRRKVSNSRNLKAVAHTAGRSEAGGGAASGGVPAHLDSREVQPANYYATA